MGYPLSASVSSTLSGRYCSPHTVGSSEVGDRTGNRSAGIRIAHWYSRSQRWSPTARTYPSCVGVSQSII